MSKIQFVFLDLDDTILDFHAAERIALAKTLREVDLEPTSQVLARYHVINRECWRQLEDGKMSREQVLVERFRILFDEYRLTSDPVDVRLRYEENLSHGHFFMPGAPALLDALFGKYRLYLASNGTAKVQAGRIASAKIAPYFDEIFISQNVGYDKPSPAFFEACFSKIPGFQRDAAVMIGDSLTSDIRGGNAAGIRTVWFNPEGEVRTKEILPTAEIRALSDLPALLDAWA